MTVSTTEVSDETLVPVRNLAAFKVTYSLPDGRRREFPPSATLKVEAGELRLLNYDLGGSRLLSDYLHVGSEPLALELGVSEDSWANEYSWGPDEIKACLESDDVDAFADALDFAPQGIVDSIIQMAVDSEVNDTRKRKLILDKTGNDVTRQIENKHLSEKTETEDKKPATRRKAPAKKTAAATRRKAAPKTE